MQSSLLEQLITWWNDDEDDHRKPLSSVVFRIMFTAVAVSYPVRTVSFTRILRQAGRPMIKRSYFTDLTCCSVTVLHSSDLDVVRTMCAFLRAFNVSSSAFIAMMSRSKPEMWRSASTAMMLPDGCVSDHLGFPENRSLLPAAVKISVCTRYLSLQKFKDTR